MDSQQRFTTSCVVSGWCEPIGKSTIFYYSTVQGHHKCHVNGLFTCLFML